jgi:hypothetical protein
MLARPCGWPTKLQNAAFVVCFAAYGAAADRDFFRNHAI